MTNNEILQAAKDAGFAPNRSYTNMPVTGYATHDLSDQIKAFAAIIEKRTIERCAVVAEELRHPDGYSGENVDWCAGTDHAAAAIRAME